MLMIIDELLLELHLYERHSSISINRNIFLIKKKKATTKKNLHNNYLQLLLYIYFLIHHFKVKNSKQNLEVRGEVFFFLYIKIHGLLVTIIHC